MRTQALAPERKAHHETLVSGAPPVVEETRRRAFRFPFLLSAFLLSAFALSGCARFVLPSPLQLKALAQDTNSIHLRVVTIYGTVDLYRNIPSRVERTQEP